MARGARNLNQTLSYVRDIMKKFNNIQLPPAKEIAFIAVEVALLIGGQAVLYPVAGVEIVTVLLLTFSWSFGPRAGVMSAICFCFLRCALWGFYPSAFVLYIIYYPLFALLFGFLGKVGDAAYAHLPIWSLIVINVTLAAVCASGIYCVVTDFLKISRLSIVLVKTLLAVIAALGFALILALDIAAVLARLGKINGSGAVKTILAAALAAICTIIFTLLDDFIAPLFLGYSLFSESWAVYFYGSFLALAPQTVCAIVSVSTLFLPLTAIFKKAAK